MGRVAEGRVRGSHFTDFYRELVLLAQKLFQLRFHGGGPDFVAGFPGMQRVFHHAGRDAPVVLDELRTEVEIEDVAAVVELRERLVDLKNLAALRAEGFTA